MRKYRLVAKKGEGTFSEVLKAQNVKDGKYHAIKCMKNHFDSIEQVNNLREIQALRRLSPHAHIITLEEVLYDQPTGRLALVFELMDANLYELIRGRRHYLNAQLVQSYMYQLLLALDHMHRKGIFHRDIKPENILIENKSDVSTTRGLKLADFGSCRGIYSKQPYTEYISTRWYRAPECLLTDGYYGPEMDLWGAGCVYFEITSLYPLFPGTNELDQINRIHKVLGTPDAALLNKFKQNGAAHVNFDFPPQQGMGLAQLIKHASADCVDLLMKMLLHDASDRISAREALRHAYFGEIRELEARRHQVIHPFSSSSTTHDESSSDHTSHPNKGLPTISSTTIAAATTTATHPSKKSHARVMPQGALARNSNAPLNKFTNSTTSSHAKDDDDGGAEPRSLPPIMGVTGGKMQQTPLKQMSDSSKKSTHGKKKKGTKADKRQQPYDVPMYAQGTSSNKVASLHLGGAASSLSSQYKSSNHFAFSGSQMKGQGRHHGQQVLIRHHHKRK